MQGLICVELDKYVYGSVGGATSYGGMHITSIG